MTRTTVDSATGTLLVGGRRVFPIGLSDPPPFDTTAPNSGLPAWAEISRAGVGFVRHYSPWTAEGFGEQFPAVVQKLDAAQRHGLQVWLALAGVDKNLSQRALLDAVVNGVKQHPGLGVWKGVDEPALGRVPLAGCVAVRSHVRALDPDHPLVIIEAPRAPAPTPGRTVRLTADAIKRYATACDIHGVDIYPLPPGAHAGGPPVNTDISVVGDMVRIVARATQHKAIWATLQIAWSGVLPPKPVVFPTLQQARFMAYDAIVSGARGLFFFGGHLKQVMSPLDRQRGWNWSYWVRVQRPLVIELTDAAHMPALLAPVAALTVKASAPDVAVSVRRAGAFLYVIAVRKSRTATGRVRFTGLPATVTQGTVLAHPGNPARSVAVAGGAFTDPSPFAPHNARVYRFRAPAP